MPGDRPTSQPRQVQWCLPKSTSFNTKIHHHHQKYTVNLLTSNFRQSVKKKLFISISIQNNCKNNNIQTTLKYSNKKRVPSSINSQLSTNSFQRQSPQWINTDIWSKLQQSKKYRIVKMNLTICHHQKWPENTEKYLLKEFMRNNSKLLLNKWRATQRLFSHHTSTMVTTWPWAKRPQWKR